MIGGSRIAVRTYFYGLFNNYLTREAVAIYGAGRSGAELAISLLNGTQYMPVAFIDDNRNLRKQTIHGVRVYDSFHLDRLVSQLSIKQIFLAMPSATVQQRKIILDKVASLPVHILTVPSYSELISGKAHINEIKEIEIGDLLGREVVPPDPELLRHSIVGKNVLVTGAGGTIGAELARKILDLKPRRLVLYDNSEFALFKIENELMAQVSEGTELVVLLGSVLDQKQLSIVMNDFAVQTVYHAAAYKHVHMVERNVIEGVRNNILGTWNLVRAVEQNKVDDFVLISTDKAVRPTNVMGASKRLAELIVQAAAARAKRTKYCMVRFGNVLRSSGSVVPLFEEQIREGGPVQVTHKDATRYFMTSSEAADLVIQAGAMSTGGDVFVLDMGDPVLIDDLARKMIHLHGKRIAIPGEPGHESDIAIEYIGLRPGEKLLEELIIGENAAGTRHPRIMKAEEEFLPWETVERVCNQLSQACDNADYPFVKRTLEEFVTGYSMIDAEVDPLLRLARHKAGSSNVMSLHKKED